MNSIKTNWTDRHCRGMYLRHRWISQRDKISIFLDMITWAYGVGGCQDNQSSQPAALSKHFFFYSRKNISSSVRYAYCIYLPPICWSSGPSPSLNALPFKHSFLPNFTHLYHISLSVVVYRSPFPVISIPLSRVQEESMPGCPRRGKRPAIGCFGQLSSFSCVLVWLSLILRHFSNRNFISSKESADCCCLFCSFCLKGSLIIRRW